MFKYKYIQWIYNRSKSRYKSHPLLNINTNGYQTVSGFVLCSSEQGYERSQYGMHIIWEVSESRCSVIPTDSFRRKANLDRVQTRHILPNLEYDFYEYQKAHPAQKPDQCWAKTENQNEFSVTDLFWSHCICIVRCFIFWFFFKF